MSQYIEADLSWKWPKCGRRLLYAVLSLFCFMASAAAFTIAFMMFCPDCAFRNTLLLWVHLVGAFLLFAIGMKTLMTIIFSRGRQNTPPSRVLISDARTGDLEDSPAIRATHRMPRRLLFVVNPLRNLVPRQNQVAEDLSWRYLPDYFTALQNSNDAGAGEKHFNEAFCTEYVPTTPPPCYEEALEMTLMAIPVSNEEKDAHFEEL